MPMFYGYWSRSLDEFVDLVFTKLFRLQCGYCNQGARERQSPAELINAALIILL